MPQNLPKRVSLTFYVKPCSRGRVWHEMSNNWCWDGLSAIPQRPSLTLNVKDSLLGWLFSQWCLTFYGKSHPTLFDIVCQNLRKSVVSCSGCLCWTWLLQRFVRHVMSKCPPTTQFDIKCQRIVMGWLFSQCRLTFYVKSHPTLFEMLRHKLRKYFLSCSGCLCRNWLSQRFVWHFMSKCPATTQFDIKCQIIALGPFVLQCCLTFQVIIRPMLFDILCQKIANVTRCCWAFYVKMSSSRALVWHSMSKHASATKFGMKCQRIGVGATFGHWI